MFSCAPLLVIMKQEGAYYRGFTEEEFAADEYFQQWVLLPDDETELYWKSYAQNHPEQQIAIANAFKLVQHLADTGFHIPFLSQSEKQTLRDNIFHQIGLPHKTIVTPLRGKKTKWWILAAAAIIAFVAISIFFPLSCSRTNSSRGHDITQNRIKGSERNYAARQFPGGTQW